MLCPTPIPVITVNHRGAARLRGGHLWVYRSDLVPPAEAPAGALVHVRDQRGRSLGSALYSSASQIAIRLLSSEEITEAQLPSLLRERIASAVQFRRRVARDTDSYRVIFSEADLLPGLIVDKYNDVLSMQALTQAFDRDDLWQIVIEALAEHFPDCSVVERVDPHIRELEQLPERQSQLVRGDRSSTIFTMNGVRFHFDGLGGQKTGAFLDQRENYAAAARYAPWRGAGLLHLSGRVRAASGARLRECDAVLTRRARRWRLPSRMSNSIAPSIAAARSNGSRPTLSTCSRTTPPPDASTTPSSSTRPPSRKPSAPWRPRCAATRSSTCAP